MSTLSLQQPQVEVEAAFRIQKSDLRIRPIWHQRDDRVLVHILVCFLADVLWKTLTGKCHAAGWRAPGGFVLSNAPGKREAVQRHRSKGGQAAYGTRRDV